MDDEQVPRNSLEISSANDLRAWLKGHHGQTESVWVVTYKRSAGDRYVSRWDVLDELLCFGWIDGRMMRLDEERVMQLISPRRVHHWAQSYKERVEKLDSQGRMHPSGLAAVALSKQLGLWDYTADIDALQIPSDLEEVLRSQNVYAEFEALPPSYRRNILRWIKLAKADATRMKRIHQVVLTTASSTRIPQM